VADERDAPKITPKIANRSTNLFAGRLVRLRALEQRDLEASLPHDLDSEVQRSGWQVEPPRSDEAARRWLEGASTAQPEGDNRRFAIEDRAGDLVGGLNVVDCNPRFGTFGYGIALFRPYWRRGYASDAIKVLLRFYFGELRYQKVLARVYDFNQASIALHCGLGFVEEGRLRRAYFTAGRHHDELLFGMTAEEFAAHHPDFAPRVPGDA
jgi:RimJ/RimL family protein N-acetyltransferase